MEHFSTTFSTAKDMDKPPSIWSIGKYNGSFRYGLKNGHGKFEFSDGRIYEGQWVDDNHTVWVMQTSTWTYEGEWNESMEDGRGELTCYDPKTLQIVIKAEGIFKRKRTDEIPTDPPTLVQGKFQKAADAWTRMENFDAQGDRGVK